MSSAPLNYTQQQQASLDDAREHTSVQKNILCPIPGIGGGGGFVEVTTTLDSGDFLLPLEEKFEFHCYYTDECWIIAEVYKKKDAATFYLNELIEMQLTKAGITKRNPKRVILKNVQHVPIVNLRLQDQGDLGLVDTLSVLNTPLTKAIDSVVLGRILNVEKFGENHICLTFSPLGSKFKA